MSGSVDGGVFRIERITAEDGERVRDIRLRMIADTPMAYVETLAEAQAQTAEQWRDRAARDTRPGSVGHVAVDAGTGEWVGQMRCFVTSDPSEVMLVSVWVAPEYRSRAVGMADALLDACTGWAREEAKASRMLLQVHEQNARAIAFYQRYGFAFTGETESYPLDRTALEYEMSLALTLACRLPRMPRWVRCTTRGAGNCAGSSYGRSWLVAQFPAPLGVAWLIACILPAPLGAE